MKIRREYDAPEVEMTVAEILAAGGQVEEAIGMSCEDVDAPDSRKNAVAYLIQSAVATEREACARVAEAHRAAEASDADLPATIAEAIRARVET